MQWLKRLVSKLLSKWTCKCTSPNYVVRGGLLTCDCCNKPINKDFLKGAM